MGYMTMTHEKKLTPQNFDAAIGGNHAEIVWTLGGIAAAVGRGPDFVRDRLAKMPGSPVKKIGGRWCARRSELVKFISEAT